MISPKHVAIIMDGNGRWGLKKKKSRNYGHSVGVKNVEKIISEVNSFETFPKEIIVVDDGSTDNTRNILKNIKNESLKILHHDRNYGKGKAIQTGIKESNGDIIIIQDADLEYSPTDYEALLRPFLEVDADVVYGSRFLGGRGYVRLHFYFHFMQINC